MADWPTVYTQFLTRDKLAKFLPNQEAIRVFENLTKDVARTLPASVEETMTVARMALMLAGQAMLLAGEAGGGGEDGPPGQPGLQGIQGPQGAQGVSLAFWTEDPPEPDAGPPGRDGATGSTGAQGAAGPALFMLDDPPEPEIAWPGPKGDTGAGATDPLQGSNAPGTFSVITQKFALMSKRLQLTGAQRASLAGTARLRIT